MKITYSKHFNYNYDNNSINIRIEETKFYIDMYESSDFVIPVDASTTPLTREMNETPWGLAEMKLVRTIEFDLNSEFMTNLTQDRTVLIPNGEHKFREWINATVETFNSKTSLRNFIFSNGSVDVVVVDTKATYPNRPNNILLHVPYKNSPISELWLHLTEFNPRYPMMVNGVILDPSNEIPVGDKVAFFERIQSQFFDKFDLSAPASVSAGSPVTIDVQLINPSGSLVTKDVEVYLTTTAGFLNKNRMILSQGTGSVILDTSGLSPGDVVRVKSGWKYWTGDDEVSISLT